MGFEDDSSQGQQEEEGRGGVGGIVNTTTPASESALEETSTNNTTTGEDAVKEIKKMAQRETKGARRWKIQVLLAMIVTGALMSVGTKYYLQKEEDDDYSESYWQFARSIQSAVEGHVDNVFLSMKSCADMITSEALTAGATFPFHTVQDFETLGHTIRKFSHSEMLGWAPLVAPQQLEAWSNYSTANQGWRDQSRQQLVQQQEKSSSTSSTTNEIKILHSDYLDGDIFPVVYDLDGTDMTPVPSPQQQSTTTTTTTAHYYYYYAPLWQTSPPPFDPRAINMNLAAQDFVADAVKALHTTREAVLSMRPPVETLTTWASLAAQLEEHYAYHRQFVTWGDENNNDKSSTSALNNPHLFLFEPIFRELHNVESDMVGIIMAVLPWDVYMTKLLPQGVDGIYAVIRNSCGQDMSYEVRGPTAHFLGNADYHDPAYDGSELIIPFERYNNEDLVKSTPGHCTYAIHLYASEKFEDQYRSVLLVSLTIAVAVSFFLLIVAFFIYDYFVSRRFQKVMDAAVKTSDLVSSLFPKAVRDRVLTEKQAATQKKRTDELGSEVSLQAFLTRSTMNMGTIDEDEDDAFMYKTKPIADLYPDTTVMFCDIAGFTAWSSNREPSQVFTLLETLYKSFDDVARRRRVYKVETIGDSYVAVSGLPDPDPDHAIVMCRFARECLRRMHMLVHKLKDMLGEDTTTLDMRFGIHSGPVTAGVLRGERARFQLFGDTMNTASRMESTSLRGKIQVSQETADLLVGAGKAQWVTPREDSVVAKGKGELRTYWLKDLSPSSSATSNDGDVSQTETADAGINQDNQEVSSNPESINEAHVNTTSSLVKWSSELLLDLMKNIHRHKRHAQKIRANSIAHSAKQNLAVLGELQDTIVQPALGEVELAPEEVVFDDRLREELETFLTAVASMHPDNPFHNFEHSCYVTLEFQKVMADLPKDVFHPLTRFAAALATLCSDIDHSGVPSVVLAHEKPALASVYENKSIGQQNAFNLAWDLLMSYANLRHAIYQNADEKRLFRQVLINSLIATDLLDREQRLRRDQRWRAAFGTAAFYDLDDEEPSEEVKDQQETVLLENMVQIATVAHMAEKWPIYKKWCRKMYLEMYKAFTDGRISSDPTERWYDGELGCFDFFVAPLIERLHSTSKFGLYVDNLVDQVEKNRKKWKETGLAYVAELAQEVGAAGPSNNTKAIPMI